MVEWAPRRAPSLGRSRWARAVLLLPTTLGLTLSACTSASTSPGSRAATSIPSSLVNTSAGGSVTAAATVQPSPADVAGRVAVAAHLAMWRDFAMAGQTSDWRSPLLAQHATGDALLQMSRGLYADHANGLVTRGNPIDHPVIASVTPPDHPTTVLIHDCGDSSRTRKYVTSTGRPVPGAPGGRQEITAETKLQPNGRWKVDLFAVEGVGSC